VWTVRELSSHDILTPMPSGTTQCSERERLLREYTASVLAYADMVRLGAETHWPKELTHESERVRTSAELAKRAYENHIRQHNCEAYRSK